MSANMTKEQADQIALESLFAGLSDGEAGELFAFLRYADAAMTGNEPLEESLVTTMARCSPRVQQRIAHLHETITEDSKLAPFAERKSEAEIALALALNPESATAAAAAFDAALVLDGIAKRMGTDLDGEVQITDRDILERIYDKTAAEHAGTDAFADDGFIKASAWLGENTDRKETIGAIVDATESVDAGAYQADTSDNSSDMRNDIAAALEEHS